MSPSVTRGGLGGGVVLHVEPLLSAEITSEARARIETALGPLAMFEIVAGPASAAR